jgi:hypothetical protein
VLKKGQKWLVPMLDDPLDGTMACGTELRLVMELESVMGTVLVHKLEKEWVMKLARGKDKVLGPELAKHLDLKLAAKLEMEMGNLLVLMLVQVMGMGLDRWSVRVMVEV